MAIFVDKNETDLTLPAHLQLIFAIILTNHRCLIIVHLIIKDGRTVV